VEAARGNEAEAARRLEIGRNTLGRYVRPAPGEPDAGEGEG
jgi:hypothetical protein